MRQGVRWQTGLVGAAPWIAVMGLIAAGWCSTLAVIPRSADANPAAFSAERAMEHVNEIAREPHPMGSTEIEEVRDYIVTEVEALGLAVDLQAVPARDVFGDGEPIAVVNVIAWIPGTANTKAVMVVGHYDTVPSTPGANDNTVAVAAMLETARALQAGPPLVNDILFLFTDGEEPSDRFGARGFAAVPGLLDSVGMVINLEASGSGGASTLVQANGPQSWLVGGYASEATTPAAYSFLTELTGLIGEIGTDFDVFSNAGLPGMHFAYLRGSPIYHTMADDIDSVAPGTLQHHGANVLAIARYFGNLDLTTVPDPDTSVFFTVRPFFVQYPAGWAPLLAIISAAVFLVSLFLPRRAAELRLGRVSKSAAASALGALAGAAAGSVLWVVLAAVRSTPVVVESYVYLVVILTIAVLAARWVTERVGGHSGDSSRRGAVALWVLLALVTALALPGFSYLFVWPALAGGAGLLWHPVRRGWAIVRFVLVAAPALLLMTPAIDYLFLFAQPRPGNPGSQVTFAALVPLLFGVLVLALLGNEWHHPDAHSPENR